jgi:hypothetical protein
VAADGSLALGELLGVERERVPVEGRGVEAPADWEHLQTPETNPGTWHGGLGLSR